MTPRRLLGMGLALLACVLVWWLLAPRAPEPTTEAAPLLPGFAATRAGLQAIELRTAGNALQVRIERVDGRWQVAERDGWPADAAKLDALLDALAKARKLEAKTTKPERHARLGVEAVQASEAKGLELRLLTAKAPLALVIGTASAVGGHRHVRLADEAQVWRVDQALDLPRSPAAWLDDRLLDRPLARIETVEVQPARGKAFVLSRVQDHFSLDGLPPAALAEPGRGDDTAALLEGLSLADVAPAEPRAATQRVGFVGVDGLDVDIEAWDAEGEVWLRCQPKLDETRAQVWLAQSEAAQRKSGLAALQAQLAEIRQRCEGRQFSLPATKGSLLMRSREHYLAD